jgi:type VI protein secretion system component Hcp
MLADERSSVKRSRVIQLGLLVLGALVVSVVAASLAFGRSSAGGNGPPATTSGQLAIGGMTINVQSYSEGASNPTTIGPGGIVPGAKASFSSLNVETSVDGSFPVLNEAVGTGHIFPTATLTFTSSSPNSTPTTVTFEIDNVAVESAQQAGASQSLSLAFERVHWTFTDANGTTTRGWNIVTNQPLP